MNNNYNEHKEFELLDELFDELFPIMRSITGPGIEETIRIFSRYIPLKIHKISTGTQVFDWTVPQEWHFNKATLIGPEGDVICDAANSNLHVLNYSEPIDLELSLEDLQAHLFSIPELPEAIPYVTSYYKKNWGFCLADSVRKKLKPGYYKAKIDATFVDGGVPYAECIIEGESKKEILISSYICHPSLANNELSGPLVLLALYNRIKTWKKRRYTYRFLLNPETIGSLCFLYNNHKYLKDNLVSGLVLTCVGGNSPKLVYKQSRKANALIDNLIDFQNKKTSLPIQSIPFNAYSGSDERQFCSPGFNLPMGQISRNTYYTYEGYHNSLDTKEFMGIDNLIESAQTIEQILLYLETAGNPINLFPYGEPQLGKRGLYPQMNSPESKTKSADNLIDGRVQLERILTLLNSADGEQNLLTIANNMECTLEELIPIVEHLENHGLITYHNNQE